MSIEIVILVAVLVAGAIGTVAFVRFNRAKLAVEDGERKLVIEASNEQGASPTGAPHESANIPRGIRAHGIEAGGSVKARTEDGQPIDASGVKAGKDVDLTMAAGPEKKNR